MASGWRTVQWQICTSNPMKSDPSGIFTLWLGYGRMDSGIWNNNLDYSIPRLLGSQIRKSQMDTCTQQIDIVIVLKSLLQISRVFMTNININVHILKKNKKQPRPHSKTPIYISIPISNNTNLPELPYL